MDRIRANEAALDTMDHLNAFLRGDDTTWTGVSCPTPAGWQQDRWAAWERCVWLWQCSITGHQPMDAASLNADELTILRLELL